jgi:hypothetical protein
MLHAPSLLSARRLAVAIVLVLSAYVWWVTYQYGRLNAAAHNEFVAAGAEIARAVEQAKTTVTRFRNYQPVCIFDLDQPFLEFEGDCSKETFEHANPRAVVDVDALRLKVERKNQKDETVGEASWRFRLDRLLDDLVVSDEVERIFFAHPNGQVLFQRASTSPLRQARSRWVEQTISATVPGSDSILFANVADLLGADGNERWKRLHGISDRLAVTVEGEWHQLHVQPVPLEAGRALLVLGGVVPTEQLLRRALAIDTYFVTVVVAALLLGTLGVPFIRLMAMGPRERFTRRDLFWLHLSLAALLAVMAFIVLGLDAAWRWRDDADQGMDVLAARFEEEIVRELRDIREALDRYDQQVVKFDADGGAIRGLDPVAAWFGAGDPDADGVKRGPGRQAKGPVILPEPGLYLDQVQWIDSLGDQIWKVTSDRSTANRSVAARPYFTAVRDGTLFDARAAHPFFFMADRSVTDGKRYSFVSMPSALGDGPCQEDASRKCPYVIAATATLLSLSTASLPTGYGYAVIEPDGRILYHSDMRLEFRHNLFDRLSPAEAARAIVAAGSPRRLTADYREVPHRFHFRPLPWTKPAQGLDSRTHPAPTQPAMFLVVFRDITAEQAVVARAVVASLIGPLLWLIVFIAAAFFAAGHFSLRHQGQHTSWMWPHGGLGTMHRWMALAFAGVIAVFFVVIVASGQSWPSLLLPVCTMAAGLTIYHRQPWPIPRAPLQRPRWYAAEFTLLAVGLVIGPVMALFSLFVSSDLGGLIDAERAIVATRVREEAQTIQSVAKERRSTELVAANAVRAQDQRRVGLQEPYDMDLEELGALDRRLVELYRSAADWLPSGHAMSTQIRYRDAENFYDPPGAFVGLSRVGALGLVALVGVFVLWVRWSASHLFLADLTPGTLSTSESEAVQLRRLEAAERRVLFQITEEGIANPRQRPRVLQLAERGFIQLDPDIKPGTAALGEAISQVRATEKERRDQREWEHGDSAQDSKHVRAVLLLTVAAAGVFLLFTQFGQGTSADIGGAVASVLTAVVGTLVVKIREAIVDWLTRPSVRR